MPRPDEEHDVAIGREEFLDLGDPVAIAFDKEHLVQTGMRSGLREDEIAYREVDGRVRVGDLPDRSHRRLVRPEGSDHEQREETAKTAKDGGRHDESRER